MADALDWGKRFPGTELTTTGATIISALTQGVIRNGTVRVSNKTASPAVVNIYVVPTTDPVTSPGADGTNVLVGYSVPANDYIEVTIPKMAAGDSLFASAGTNNALEIFDVDMLVRV